MTKLPRRYFFQLVHVQFPHVVDVHVRYEVKQGGDELWDYDSWEPLLWCVERFGVKNIASSTLVVSGGRSIREIRRRSYCSAAPYVAMRGTTIRFKNSGDAALCKLIYG